MRDLRRALRSRSTAVSQKFPRIIALDDLDVLRRADSWSSPTVRTVHFVGQSLHTVRTSGQRRDYAGLVIQY